MRDSGGSFRHSGGRRSRALPPCAQRVCLSIGRAAFIPGWKTGAWQEAAPFGEKYFRQSPNARKLDSLPPKRVAHRRWWLTLSASLFFNAAATSKARPGLQTQRRKARGRSDLPARLCDLRVSAPPRFKKALRESAPATGH